MKKKIIILIVGIVFLLSGVGFTGQDKRHKKKKRSYHHEQKYNRHYHPSYQKRGKAYGHYKHRRYERYRKHRYKRHYHWREWNRERVRHQRRYKGGHYHHDDNGYLMFSFCNKQNGDKMCFSISID